LTNLQLSSIIPTTDTDAQLIPTMMTGATKNHVNDSPVTAPEDSRVEIDMNTIIDVI